MTIQQIGTQNTTEKNYVITSTGTIGKCSKTVDKPFHVIWKNKGKMKLPTNMAVFTKQTITLTGSATIDGPVGTNSQGIPANSPSIIIKGGGGYRINGDVWVGPNTNPQTAIDLKTHGIKIKTVPKNLTATQPLILPPFPKYPTPPLHPDVQTGTETMNKYDVIKNGNINIDSWQSNNYTLVLDQDYTLHDINLTSNNTLYIDTGTKDRQLIVDNINLKSGHIILKGSGKLTLYIKNGIDLNAGSTINNYENQQNGPTARLNVYIEGQSNINLTGSQMIYGSIYAKDANFDITGGGGFQGNILTGGNSFRVSGGAKVNSQLIFAPNADFKLNGGGNISGVIISKTLSASGGTLIHQPIEVSEIPYFLTNNSTNSGVTLNQLITTDALKELN